MRFRSPDTLPVMLVETSLFLGIIGALAVVYFKEDRIERKLDSLLQNQGVQRTSVDHSELVPDQTHIVPPQEFTDPSKKDESAPQQEPILVKIDVLEQFSSAVKQLSDDRVVVRAAAVQSLKKIMALDWTYSWPTVEIFSEIIRNRTVEDTPENGALPDLPLDVQTMMTVIARRDKLQETYEMRLDLTGAPLMKARLREMDFNANVFEGTDLREADLAKVDFRWVQLRGADLRGANLSGALLNHSDLRDVKLEGARFSGANLRETDFSGRDLSGMDFRGAIFLDVNLKGTQLRGTNLRGADLRHAKNITARQIEEAITDEWTLFPSKDDAEPEKP